MANQTRKLDDNFLRGLKPTGEAVVIRDTLIPGFALRTTKRGDMKWQVTYRDPATLGGASRKRRTVQLGLYKLRGVGAPEMGLSAARAAARTTLAKVALAEPMGEEVEPEDGGGGFRVDAPKTLGDAFDRWLEVEARSNATYKLQRWHLKKVVPSEFRELPLEAVTLGHCRQLHAQLVRQRGRKLKSGEVESGVTTATRVLATVSSALSYAADYEWIDRNPLHGRRRKTIFKKPQRKPKRFLAVDEIRTVWTAANTVAERDPRLRTTADVTKLLLLTACRLREVLYARWEEIDDEHGLQIPGHRWIELDGGRQICRRTKNKRPHRVQLTRLGWEIVRALPSRGQSEWLFPSPRTAEDRPVTDVKNGAARLREEAGLALPWDLKALRRPWSTHATKAGVSRLHVSLCLNHTVRAVDNLEDHSAEVTEDHYVDTVWAYREEMDAAWNRMDRYLGAIVKGEEPKILEFKHL